MKSTKSYRHCILLTITNTGKSILLLIFLSFAAVAQGPAQVLTVNFDDPVGDVAVSGIDVTEIELTFSTLTGAYLMRLRATAAQPFNNEFYRININTNGQRPMASAEADVNSTVTIGGLQLAADAEGAVPIPIESITSDTGLVFRIENGVAIPFVGDLVYVDIKSGESPDSVNSKSKGKIPIAIISSEDLDAPQSIDVASLTFGVTGPERSLAFCNRNGEDLNGDGRPDLMCHFQTQSVGLRTGVTHLILAGRTTTGEAIHGTDSVRVVH